MERDLRFAFRGLLKRLVFTAIAVITLGVAIAASTAIFSIVNSMVLRRLPYRTADPIMVIKELNPEGKRIQVTGPNFIDWRAQNTVFEHLAAIKTRNVNLTLADQAERIDMAQTSADFFEIGRAHV